MSFNAAPLAASKGCSLALGAVVPGTRSQKRLSGINDAESALVLLGQALKEPDYSCASVCICITTSELWGPPQHISMSSGSWTFKQ